VEKNMILQKLLSLVDLRRLSDRLLLAGALTLLLMAVVLGPMVVDAIVAPAPAQPFETYSTSPYVPAAANPGQPQHANRTDLLQLQKATSPR
jgi:hypothetical protein